MSVKKFRLEKKSESNEMPTKTMLFMNRLLTYLHDELDAFDNCYPKIYHSRICQFDSSVPTLRSVEYPRFYSLWSSAFYSFSNLDNKDYL